MSDDDEHPVERVSAADEQALTDLFASLVADAPASGVSPAEVIELARAERRNALDLRIKRFKVLRNVLVAAALAALVVLVVPHLGPGSSSSTAASSSSAAAQVPAAAAAAAAGSGYAAGSSEAASGAMSAAAPSAAAASGAVSSGAVSSGGALVPQASGATCAPLSAASLAAVRAAFPVGSFGPAQPVADCAGSGANPITAARLPWAGSSAGSSGSPTSLLVTVGRSAPGACSAVGCVQRAGTDEYATRNGSSVWVYGKGFQVMVEISGNMVGPPAPDHLAAAGRAVIASLG